MISLVGIFLVFGIVGAFINRARGAWFKEYVYNSTVLARLVWALPSALVVYIGLVPDSVKLNDYGRYFNSLEINPIISIFLITVFFYASWALWGSGAHSVLKFSLWKEQWLLGLKPDDTELYTQGWLPWLFNGTPNEFWYDDDFIRYHTIGKSVEGGIRNLTAILPVFMLDYATATLFVASGLLWGPLFWLAWELDGDEGWSIGECMTGFLSWGILGVCLYG